MRAIVSWWDLGDTDPSIDDLRRDLADDGVEAWSDVAGLALKLWISDDERNLWGAVMVWDDQAPSPHLLPLNRAAERIGRPADTRAETTVETLVRGTGRMVL